jgi:hypothetical protein
MKKLMGSFLTAFAVLMICDLNAQNTNQLESVIYTSHYDHWNFYVGRKDVKTGKIVIPPVYDQLEDSKDGLILAGMNDKYGYINAKGQVIIPLKYSWGLSFSEGLAAVRLNEKWGFIGKTGAVVISLKYEDAAPFSQGLASVKLNGKYGFINKTGAMVIPAIYDKATNFQHGVSIVVSSVRKGVIDKSGKMIIPFGDYDIKYFDATKFIITSGNLSGVMDRQGNWVLPMEYRYIEGFAEFYQADYKVCRISKGSNSGLITRECQFVLQPEIEKLEYTYHKGIYKLMKINANGAYECALFKLAAGKLVSDYIYDDIGKYSEGFAAFVRDGLVGFLDTNGVEVVPPVYLRAWEFKDGYAMIEDDLGMALIDKNFRMVTDHYDHIIGLQNNCYAVNVGGSLDKDNNVTGGKFGVLDRNLKPIAEVSYDQMTDFNKYGILFLIRNAQLVILDTNGAISVVPQVKDIAEFSDGLAAVRWDTTPGDDSDFELLKWGFMNTKGDLVIDPRFDEGYSFSDGVAFVSLNEQYVLINKTGKVLLSMDNYADFQTEFSDKRAWVKKDDKYGYIDNTGKLVLPCVYDYASPFKEGQAEVGKDDADLIISTTGLSLRKFDRSNVYDDYDE